MSLSVSGKAVKAKKTSRLTSMENRLAILPLSVDYNHIRIQFPDKSERHLLLTDTQVKRAIDRATNILNDLPTSSWLREIWYEDCLDIISSDVNEVIEKYSLPNIAKKFNHIFIKIDKSNIHLLLSDSDIRKGLDRAEEFNKLPKVSWINDANKK